MWFVSSFAALAQDPAPAELPLADPAAETVPTPRAVRKVMPKYPAVRVQTEIKCVLKLSIDTEGVPTVLEVTGCDEPFSTSASSAFSAWRFEQSDVIRLTTVATLFKPAAGSFSDSMTAEQYQVILGAHDTMTTERAEGAACRVELTINPAGDVMELRSNGLPDCMLIPSDGAVLPAKVWKGVGEGAVCELALRAMPEGIQAVTAGSCPTALLRATEKLARRWSYNLLDPVAGTPYELQVSYRP